MNIKTIHKGQKNDKTFLDEEEGNDVIISDDVFIKHLIFQSLEIECIDKGFCCTLDLNWVTMYISLI